MGLGRLGAGKTSGGEARKTLGVGLGRLVGSEDTGGGAWKTVGLEDWGLLDRVRRL